MVVSTNDGDDPKQKTLSPAPAPEEGTRIDLGEDLLDAKTAMFQVPGSEPPATPERLPETPELIGLASAGAGPVPPIALEQVSDLLESARILMSEGLLEDSKRLLRRILLTDPSRVDARKLLDSIHELELKQIFGESETPRKRVGWRERRVAPEQSAEEVLSGLERDLELGTGDLPSLFRDAASMQRFGEQMDRDFSSSPASERVDLGIAFLEMGLSDLAARHFRAACATLRHSSDGESLVSATSLLAQALLQGGRAFEATIELQPLLNDVEIERPEKLDLIYLMGRAFEALGKPLEARQWYAQATEIEPGYRDTGDRLRRAPKS